MKRGFFRVGAPQFRFATGVFRAQHVIVGQQVRVAEVFGRLRPIAQHYGVAANLQVRKHGANLHSILRHQLRFRFGYYRVH